MNSELTSTTLGLLLVSAPLAVACVVYWFASRRKPRPDASESERKSKFGLAYIVIQLAITIMAASEGIASKRTENVPVWGLAVFTTWGSAIAGTPLLSILGDMIIQILIKIYENTKGAKPRASE